MHHSPTHGVLGPCFISLLMFSACSGGFLCARGRGKGEGCSDNLLTLLQLHDASCARVESSRGRGNFKLVFRETKTPPAYAVMEW